MAKTWPTVRLGDHCNVVRGGSPRPAGDPRFFGSDFIPWLTVASITNIDDAKRLITSTQGFLTEAGSRHSRRFRPGTVVIANSGWKCGVAKVLGIECCGNDGIAALHNLTDFDPFFVAYWVNSKTERLRVQSAAGNEQPNLNTDRIAALRLPLPPLHEQQAVAEALSDADGVIEGLERLIEKKRRIKQGAMQDLLTAKRRLPGFSGEWEERKLGEVAYFGKGKGLPKSHIKTMGDVFCVHYGSLFREQPVVIRRLETFAQAFSGATLSSAGDVLMPTSDVTPSGLAVARCIGVDGVLLGGDILIIRPSKEQVEGQFLASTIRRDRNQIMELVSGSTVFHIYAGDMANFKFALPPLEEQVAISSTLEDMDAEITVLEARLQKARQIKEGMMQTLLTGRIRLA